MSIDELIQQMTPQQAYRLREKAAAYAETLPEPDWSCQEGHWARAAAAGLVDGTNPEGYLRRDELTAVLGRKGLL